ncbi:MAG TPA: TonB-dependent receptor [Draconibacterium sp.]|nr:TonB-dependent receptor [Draconibacterium sp.]
MEQCVIQLPSLFRRRLKKLRLATGMFLLLLAMAINVQASTYSESVKFDLKLNKVSLKEVFQTITDQSEFKFIYNNDVVNDKQKVSVNTDGARVEEILNEILPQFNLEYRVVDKQVIVFPVEEKTKSESSIDSNGQQQKTITGKVVDNTGSPLPGVAVVVKGTTIGAVTDIDGNYSLDVPASAETLSFSFIGMKNQEIAIGNQTAINVTLVSEVTDLDEVVVVGYGTQKRANVVGSVTTVNGEKLAAIPAMNVSNAISGYLPGSVVIQQTGEPGQMRPRVLVRGRTTLGGDAGTYADNTAPLVVIDGIPGRSMDEIDPNDVESLSILKDASAAIYGAQAANGVILIKTKSGAEGKPRLNYQFYSGMMTPTVIPEVTNAADYATMLSEYQVYQGKARRYTDNDIELFRSGVDPWEHPNTDWYGDLIEKWTNTTRHNVTLDGGANGMKYYVSFGYKTDDAIYKASSTKYKQYNVRTKLEMPINDWLKTNVELAGFLNDRQYPYKSADAIVGQSTRLVPTNWSYWPTSEGRYPGPDIEYGDNPVETQTFSAGVNDQKTYRVLSTFGATIDVPFVKGLSFTGSYSFDLTNYYNKAFYQPWILYYPNWDQATRNSQGYITDMPLTPTPRGLSTPENAERYDRTINQTTMFNVNYIKSVGDHNISFFAGYEQYQSDWNYFRGYRKYYISSIIQTMNAGNAKDQNLEGNASIYARKSVIGRATYDYQGKYLAEVVFRADGSLKFPETKRWGYFPGVLVGWRASEEGFWKDNLSAVNYFKLRASYGMMGMDPGDPFQYLNSYGISTGMTFGTSGAIATAVGPPVIANPNITWETQTTYNVGFDSKLLNDLLHFNIDMFKNRREDILATKDASVPNFTGLSLPQENIGIVDNRGIEFEAGIHKAINKDLFINFGGNFSYNKNEIVYMDEPERSVPWQQLTGHPYGAQLMYNAIGIYKDQAQVDGTPHVSGAKPGDVIFEDVSGDGEITNDDRILVDEYDYPFTFYGLNMDATYKGFTLSILLQGQGKVYKRSQYDNRRGEAGNYYQWQFDNRWTPTNTETDVARAYNRDDLYWSPDVRMSTYWLENCAYLRLKNVVLNYAIPTNYYSKAGIAKISVFVSGNDVALLYSANKIWDPEANNPGVYPLMKTFAVGANITF